MNKLRVPLEFHPDRIKLISCGIFNLPTIPLSQLVITQSSIGNDMIYHSTGGSTWHHIVYVLDVDVICRMVEHIELT